MTLAKLALVDLFSGAGGASRGFTLFRDQFKILGAVDYQVSRPSTGPGGTTKAPGCNDTYALNNGVTPFLLDLARETPRGLRDRLGLGVAELDVLVACPPCTGFSGKQARNHSGDDPRNHLLARTAKFLRELRPRYFVMENVPQVLSPVHRHHWSTVERELQKLSYTTWHSVLDLHDLGLPQRRRRFLMIAARDTEVSGLVEATQLGKPSVRAAIHHLPPIAAGSGSDDPMHRAPGLSDPVLRRIQAIPRDGGSWHDILDSPDLGEHEKMDLLIPSMLNGRPRKSFPDVYGRLKWDLPAVTITRECSHVGNGRYTHPVQDRLLSIREMALLQGFPPDYQFVGSIRSRYNQIGDAVPPVIAALLAATILHLEGRSVNLEGALASAGFPWVKPHGMRA